MKTINKYIVGTLLLGAATMGLNSCDLDEYNPSGEGADEVFVYEDGLESLVNQLYYNFRWKYFGREDPVLYMEGSGDIWANIPEKNEYGMQLTRYVNLQGDRGQVKTVWERVYDVVNVANAVINRVPDGKDLSDEVKKDFDGEARFMRAYSYWWLVEFFGDIEMRTQETTTPVFTAQRTDRKVIYDEVIIPDLEKAASELGVTPYNGNVGRATKKAAYGLLARAYLTRAQYETEGSAEQKAFYQKALETANYVISNKSALGIQLYDTYDEIWQAKNNKTNTEFLWVTQHSQNTSLDANPKNPNRLHLYWAPRLKDRPGITVATDYEYPNESVLLMPTYYLLNLYQDWDIRYDVLFQEEFPTNAVRGTYKWSQVMVNNFRAPQSLVGKSVSKGETVLRFSRTPVSVAEREAVNYAYVDINDVYETENKTALGGCKIRNPKDTTATTQYIANFFPRFKKYRIWDGDESGTILLAAPNGSVGFADVPMIRYAEMGLIAAEAYIGLGDQALAASVINKEIRNARVVKPGHNLSEAQVTASQMTIEWILEERARELCGEWLRWFDLKRTGKLVDYVRGHNPAMDGNDVVDNHNYLWPIPNAFLDKLQNAEEFGQNPGYDPYVRSN